MKQLWAPWRLAYLKDPKNRGQSSKECPFCTIQKEEASQDNLCLWKGEKVYVVQNKFPYNPYHLMVIPYEHKGQVQELSKGVWIEMQRATHACVELIGKELAPHGFNLGINLGEHAGAGIAPHLHQHILPRWKGDTNFMPLIAETKALPTHNATIYQKLRPLFDQDFALAMARV